MIFHQFDNYILIILLLEIYIRIKNLSEKLLVYKIKLKMIILLNRWKVNFKQISNIQ